MRGKTSRHVRRPKPGDLASLRRTLWGTIRRVEDLIHGSDEDVSLDQQLRAVHALAALAGQYLKVTEAAELVERIERLESIAAYRDGDRRDAWAAT